jgi:hypothetical protein
MARFVSDERVPIYLEEDPLHIIYIRPKMNVGIQNRVMSSVASIKGGSEGQDVAFDIGAYNTALLVNNVMGWEGPDFDNVPCTSDNIKRLDPDDPLLDKVLGEINRRNTKGVNTPDPKSSSSNGHDASKPKAKDLTLVASGSGTTT